MPAVIDKDFASECMAEQLDADMLIILTAVEKVAINFGKPDQKNLDELTPEEARKYMAEGQFAPGSMLPKVEAAVKFAESKPGRTALITLLEKAKDGIAGKTGTCYSIDPATRQYNKSRKRLAFCGFSLPTTRSTPAWCSPTTRSATCLARPPPPDR